MALQLYNKDKAEVKAASTPEASQEELSKISQKIKML